MKPKKNMWGWDLYAIGIIVIGVHMSVIVAKFFGKDLGPSIPESLKEITMQMERLAYGYAIYRAQRQVNNAHQRVTKVKKDVGITS